MKTSTLSCRFLPQVKLSHLISTRYCRRKLLSTYTKTLPVVNRWYNLSRGHVLMCTYRCVLIPASIIPPYHCRCSQFPQCCCCARSRACWGLFLKTAILTHTKVLLIQALCQGLAEQICCGHRETHIQNCCFRFLTYPHI